MKEKDVKISVRIERRMYEWILREIEKGNKGISEVVRECIEGRMR